MKKRLWMVLLAVVLTTACLMPASALAEYEVEAMWVKMPNYEGSLNLRSAPNTNSGVNGWVVAGDSVLAYEGSETTDNYNENWVYVKVDRTGKTGYLKLKYLTENASEAVLAEHTVSVPNGGYSLRLFSGPGEDFEVTAWGVHGEALEIIERGSEWSRVKVVRSGRTAYIKTANIKTIDLESTTPQPGTTPAPDSYDVATIMSRTALETANLRRGPGMDYDVITELYRGTRLDVVGQSGNWYKIVTPDNVTGYVYESYVAFDVYGTVHSEVNLRTGPGTSYTLLRELAPGTNVIVHSISGSWARITLASDTSRTGYIHTGYLAY